MRRSETTRERIRSEALRLFVERGVDAVSMRDLADAAGIRAASLYNHWPSREALVTGLFVEGYAEYGRRIAEAASGLAPFADRLERMVRLICRLQAEDRDLFAFLLLSQHRALGAVPSQGNANPVDVMQRAVDAAMRAGEIPRGDPALVTATIVGAVIQAATFRLYGRLAHDLEEVADELVAICLRAAGVRTRETGSAVLPHDTQTDSI